MRKFVKFFFFLMIIATLGGFLFYTNYGVRGSGVKAIQAREVDGFQRISIEGIGLLNVSIGEQFSVIVTADDNLIDLVETEVSNNELVIRSKKPLNPTVAFVIDVVLPDLTHVELAGAASLNLIDYQGESLAIELAGACGADATGSVGRLELELAGACRARLEDLESKRAFVEIAGTGSAKVFASESLDAEANGVATITCYGNPAKVKKEANGISRVKIIGT